MFEMIGDVEEVDWSVDMVNVSFIFRIVLMLFCFFLVLSVLCKWVVDFVYEFSYWSLCGIVVIIIFIVVEVVVFDSSVERILICD